MGRLTRDPEVRKTKNDKSVCNFSVACNRSYARDTTDFLDVTAFGATADFVQKYFTKGSMIIVQGSVETNHYEDKNGNKRTSVYINANNVHFAGSKSTAQNDTPAVDVIADDDDEEELF